MAKEDKNMKKHLIEVKHLAGFATFCFAYISVLKHCKDV